jgi:hypothetical protein
VSLRACGAAKVRPRNKVAGGSIGHQTGWTGLVAKLVQFYGQLDAERALEVGKQAAFAPSKSTSFGAKT